MLQKERNWFIEELQKLAKARRIRVSFVSGDVHVAAVGVFSTLQSRNTPAVKPAQDYRYMLNVTTSQSLSLTLPWHLLIRLTQARQYLYVFCLVAKGKTNVETDYSIVNTPPPNPVITLVSSLASKTHKTLHHIDTDETMVLLSNGYTWHECNIELSSFQVPIFGKDTDGSSRKQKYIMGRRNWCIVERDEMTGEMIFDVRVERAKGEGNSVG